MKKSVVGFILVLVMLIGTKVAAASAADIEAVISGKVEKGENIQIVINIKDIKSLYAGDIEFKYDPSVLKLKGIELGDLISKPGIGKFDAINKVDGENGTARYAFSCFGQVNGFSGTGTLIKINAEVLKKETISINSKPFLKAADSTYNLKLQLCDSDVKELEYTFKPLNPSAVESKPVENKPADNEGSTGSSTNTGTTTNGGTSSSNTNTNNTANNNTANNPNTTDPQKVEDNKSQSPVEQRAEVKPSGDNQQQNNAPDSSTSKTAEKSKGYNNLAAIIGLLVLVFGGVGAGLVWKKKHSSKNASL